MCGSLACSRKVEGSLLRCVGEPWGDQEAYDPVICLVLVVLRDQFDHHALEKVCKTDQSSDSRS